MRERIAHLIRCENNEWPDFKKINDVLRKNLDLEPGKEIDLDENPYEKFEKEELVKKMNYKTWL